MTATRRLQASANTAIAFKPFLIGMEGSGVGAEDTRGGYHGKEDCPFLLFGGAWVMTVALASYRQSWQGRYIKCLTFQLADIGIKNLNADFSRYILRYMLNFFILKIQ